MACIDARSRTTLEEELITVIETPHGFKERPPYGGPFFLF